MITSIATPRDVAVDQVDCELLQFLFKICGSGNSLDTYVILFICNPDDPKQKAYLFTYTAGSFWPHRQVSITLVHSEPNRPFAFDLL